jgi:hypothetical protein
VANSTKEIAVHDVFRLPTSGGPKRDRHEMSGRDRAEAASCRPRTYAGGGEIQARESNGTRTENESRVMHPGSRKMKSEYRMWPGAREPGNLGVIQHP